MTRFASRSSRFVLFAPRDTPTLSLLLSTLARRAHPKPCRAFTTWCKREDYPVLARARARVFVIALRTCICVIRVYICICTRADGRARAQSSMRECGSFGYVPPDAATANEK